MPPAAFKQSFVNLNFQSIIALRKLSGSFVWFLVSLRNKAQELDY